jgi:hypothetical protein
VPLPDGGKSGPSSNTTRNTEIMEGMGDMMWGMGLIWILILVVLVLVIAALAKYLRS